MIILHSDQKLPFGKYIGKTIEEVIKLDPDYFKRPIHPKHDKYAFADEVIHKAYNQGVTYTR